MTPGSRLGPYEVLAAIGAGGMGEVYRARDTKLNRDVAIKVLPPAFAQDAERLARFQREAQMLAALNHPNIAAIYGIKENALVMELVEGEPLSGPMPLEDIIPIARQIAEALEYAHEKGIIHRDLKPANIKVTPHGVVKLLDFGLAKALEDSPAAADLSNSPTMSIAATKAGIIMGTAAYMSPEQAKGRPADRRSDIWSFGIVVLEMLTGKQTFNSATLTETWAAVIRDAPSIPDGLPPAITRLLRRCLEKDPRRRLQAIGEARIALETPAEAPAITAAAPATAKSARSGRIWIALSASVLSAAVLLAIWRPWRSVPKPEPIRRVSIDLGADASVAVSGKALALSPDGALLAFVEAAGKRLLYLRRLDQLKAASLAGTDNARDPFFSPDSQWIGFAADNKLKKVSIHGGSVVTLCDAPGFFGGAWASDGTILFALSSGGLMRVSDAGGTPQVGTTLDSGEFSHRWPQLLPGDKAVVFTARAAGGSLDDAQIDVQVLATGRKKTVQRGGYHGRYLPTSPSASTNGTSGHLVYIHEGTLFASGFDVNRLEMTSQPAPVIEGVSSNISGGASQFDFTSDGTLFYLPGRSRALEYSINWLSAGGKVETLRSTPGNYSQIRFSPDGGRLALQVYDGKQSDVWVLDWKRDAMTRLTFEGGQYPAWTADGRRIAFVSGPKASSIYWRRADGAGEVQQLTSRDSPRELSWHPSGKFLAFAESNSTTNFDIMILPMEGDEASGWKPGKPYAFLNTPFMEVAPTFSPDGRWLAYCSNESGKMEVYVRPFPGPGGRWQVSTGGGYHPTWSHNGKQLFFRAEDNRITAVGYTVKGDSFQADKPRPFAEAQVPVITSPIRNFDLHPDGKRFAVLQAPQQGEGEKRDRLVLITNFFEELRRRAPGKH